MKAHLQTISVFLAAGALIAVGCWKPAIIVALALFAMFGGLYLVIHQGFAAGR